jgi:hypothetical protein
VNLASAYGQQWKSLKEQGEQDLQRLCGVRNEALRMANEALKIDNNDIWRNRLRQLLQKGVPKDPVDNDLEVFEKDNKFRQLLGLPQVPAAEDSGKDCPDPQI